MSELYEQIVWSNYMMNCVSEIKILKLNFINRDQSFMKKWNNAILIDKYNNVDENVNIIVNVWSFNHFTINKWRMNN